MRPDIKVAEVLRDEGFGGPVPRTADGKRKHLEALKRNVCNDRAYWKKTWRTQKRATNEDTAESRGEYVATLDYLQDVGVEILSDPKVKGTPRSQALVATTKVVEAKAKAAGVAEIPPAEPEAPDSGVPFFGLMLSTEKVSPEAQKVINGWITKRKRE